MKNRIILKATEGKLLTDGRHIGKVVQLSVQEDPANWHEITEAEAGQMLGFS